MAPCAGGTLWCMPLSGLKAIASPTPLDVNPPKTKDSSYHSVLLRDVVESWVYRSASFLSALHQGRSFLSFSFSELLIAFPAPFSFSQAYIPCYCLVCSQKSNVPAWSADEYLTMVHMCPRAAQPSATSPRNARILLGLVILACVKSWEFAECATGDQNGEMGLLAVENESRVQNDASLGVASEIQPIGNENEGKLQKNNSKALVVPAVFAMVVCIAFVAAVSMLRGKEPTPDGEAKKPLVSRY